MELNQGIRTWQWVVTVIVIIILIVLGYNLFKGDNATAPTTDTINTTTSPAVDANEINRLVIADQFPGNVVYVSSAQLANGGWVVIHKDAAGKPGAIIGYVYGEKGIAPAKVSLTEKTVDGQLYYAMIHSDNGDKKFEAAKDLPLKDSRGNIIMKTFRASSVVTEMDKAA